MKALAQLSGGMDSVAALNELLLVSHHDAIYPIFFDYGQPYLKQEQAAALYAVNHFQSLAPDKVRTLLTVKVPLLVTSTTDVSEYVPMRNLALTAVSVNYALGLGCTDVVIGSKSQEWRQNDPYSFKDSTRSFYSALEDAVWEGTEPGADKLYLMLPVLGWSKAEVITALLKAGFDLHKLWSCYRTGEKPCGGCHHCREIAEAMHDTTVQSWLHRELT